MSKFLTCLGLQKKKPSLARRLLDWRKSEVVRTQRRINKLSPRELSDGLEELETLALFIRLWSASPELDDCVISREEHNKIHKHIKTIQQHLESMRWTPKTGPQVKMDFRRSAGEEKADYESKTQTA